MSPDEGHHSSFPDRNDGERQSSEGPLSRQTTSDGVRTAVKKGLRLDMGDDKMGSDAEEISEDGADVQSFHYYPPVSSSHKTEMPYLEADSGTINSDA